MKVIIPNRLELLSCSVSEGDEVDGALWDASATYGKGVRARHEHVRYESLADGNRGNNPAETWSGISARWKRLGATAPYRMLDDFVETQTVSPEGVPLIFGVPFDRATALALLNVEGGAARVTVSDNEDDEEALYTADISLTRDIASLSPHAYNYELIDSRVNVAVTDIPMPIMGTLNVSIDPGQGSAARLGHVVVGAARYLGATLYDVEVGMTDYSRKDVDDFGVATLVRRSFASTTSLPLYLRPERMDFVARVLQSVRATPCVWIGDNRDDGHQSLTVYGWLEDWRMVCAGPNEIQLSLEIQGLI